MSASGFELRPRNIVDLIDASVRLYRRHFATLLGVSAVLLVPFGITHTIGQYYLSLATQPLQTGAVAPDAAFPMDVPSLVAGLTIVGIAILIASVLGPLSQGALALAISERYLGRPIGALESYRRVLPYWWPLFAIGLAFGLLVAIGPVIGVLLGAAVALPLGLGEGTPAGLGLGMGAMLLGVGLGLPFALLFFTWFVLYEQTVVLEGLRNLDSLQRSRQLVKGHGLHVFGALFVTGMATGIVASVLTAPLTIAVMVVVNTHPTWVPVLQLLAQCMQHVVNIVVGPVFMIVQTLVYYDLRIRKEGFDLATMAAALGEQDAAEPTRLGSPPAAGSDGP
jgi:hypothetical protein